MLRHIPTFEEVKNWATGGNIGLGDLAGVSASGEGPGNGFDADTVDGNDAAAFAQAVHGHAYSDLSGVTGAGSGGGLNADLLDGKHASEIGGDGLTEEQVEDIVGAMAGYGLEYDDPDGILRKTRQGPNPYDAAESWAESDLTLSHDTTFVQDGALRIASRKTGSTAGPAGSYNNSAAGNTDQGIVIKPNRDLDAVRVTLAGSAGGSGPYAVNIVALYDFSKGEFVREHTGSFNGGAEFLFQYPFKSGTEYAFVCDGNTGIGAGGDDFYWTWEGGLPVSTSDFDVTADWYAGNKDGSDWKMFSNVEALLPSDSGSAVASWPDDREVAEWDVATFQKVADGGTVDVFVAYNDGTGWTRANGGNPITRAYSLADDSAISPSDNLRLEFELSRTDGGQSPRVDAAYLSWYV